MQVQDRFVRIQNKGLITIPKNFRKALGFVENDLARVRRVGGKLILEPVRVLPYPVRSYTDEEVKDFIKLDKKESKDLKKKGLL